MVNATGFPVFAVGKDMVTTSHDGLDGAMALLTGLGGHVPGGITDITDLGTVALGRPLMATSTIGEAVSITGTLAVKS